MEGVRRIAFGVLVVIAVIAALILALRPSTPPASGPMASASTPETGPSAVASMPPPAPAPGPTSVLPIDPKRVLDKPPADKPKCEGLEFVDSVEGKSHNRGCIVRHADGGIVREGPWTSVDPEGWTSAGAFKDDMKEGRWTRWYPNGTVAGVEEWSADQRNGVQIQWDENGARIMERTWRNGLLDGDELLFMPDGSTVRHVWRKGVEQK